MRTKRVIRENGRKTLTDNPTAARVESKLGTIEFAWTHPASKCLGRHCIIHNPIRPTKYRNLWWRGDRGFFEEICPCSVGHPSAEDVEYWREIGDEYSAVHGCCGVHCYTAGFEDPVL